MKSSQNVVIGFLVLFILYMMFMSPRASGYGPASTPLKKIVNKLTGKNRR